MSGSMPTPIGLAQAIVGQDLAASQVGVGALDAGAIGPQSLLPAGSAEPVIVPEIGRFTALDFLNGYAGVFIVSFLITLKTPA